MALRKLILVPVLAGIVAAFAPGCSENATVVTRDAEQIRKDKEESGKKVLEPVPVTPGKGGKAKKGSGGPDNSL